MKIKLELEHEEHIGTWLTLYINDERKFSFVPKIPDEDHPRSAYNFNVEAKMNDEIQKFRGSPEELAVAIESMMLRLTDLVNQADDYDLEELKDIDVGVWFLVGQALALLGKSKQLLLGEDPAAIAADWVKLMELDEPLHAALYSASQDAFHVEELLKTLTTNVKQARAKTALDYAIVAIGTKEECHAAIEEIRELQEEASDD